MSLRLFTALRPPDPILQACARLQNGLEGARWTDFDNLHITLTFIGEVPEPLADEIADALSRIAFAPLTLTLSGLDFFGQKRKKPRMVHAVVPDTPDLAALKGQIDSALHHLGAPVEARQFRPHLTLARLKGTPFVKLADWMAARAPFETEAFEINSFALYSSTLTHHGPIYRIERDYAAR